LVVLLCSQDGVHFTWPSGKRGQAVVSTEVVLGLDMGVYQLYCDIVSMAAGLQEIGTNWQGNVAYKPSSSRHKRLTR